MGLCLFGLTSWLPSESCDEAILRSWTQFELRLRKKIPKNSQSIHSENEREEKSSKWIKRRGRTQIYVKCRTYRLQ